MCAERCRRNNLRQKTYISDRYSGHNSRLTLTLEQKVTNSSIFHYVAVSPSLGALATYICIYNTHGRVGPCPTFNLRLKQ